jgi:hypothetical protein
VKSFSFPKLSAVLVVFSIAATSGAAAEDSKYELDGKLLPPKKGQFQITFNQGADGNFGDRYSYRVNPSTEVDPTRPLPHYSAILPACRTASDVTCIESVESRKISEGSWIKGILSKNQLDVKKLKIPTFTPSFYEYGTWSADKLSNLAAAGVASSWDFPTSPHRDGFSYLAIVQFGSSLISERSAFNPELGFSELNGMIQPWSWTCVEYGYCDWLGSRIGGSNFVLPEDIEFRMTIRTNFLSSRIGTWVVGRLEKPTVDFNSEKLTISGRPVVYPMGFSMLESQEECVAKISSVMSKYYPRAPEICTSGSAGFSTNSNDEVALELFDALGGSVIQNSQLRLWTFSNVKKSNKTEACPDPKSFSFATSNAMLYSVNPPVWDKENSTLSYRIASTHLDRNGNVNKGSYSLAISKKKADCLWKFDTSKASATISITNSEGTQNIAVSSLRTSKDWIYFDASGFTFSAPEIKVKLIDNSAKLSTKSITCTKGSKSKKVSGVSPKCPAGFKLKK